VLFGILLLLATTPAVADWLVLNDGSTIETVGPWKTRGVVLVFTREDGRLVSLRATEVDLEASTKLSSSGGPRKSPPYSKPALPPGTAKFVITDADVAHSEPGTAAAPRSADPDGTQPEGLTVSEWSQRDLEGGGTRVSGVLENRSRAAEAGIRLTIVALEDGGSVVTTQPAVLEATTLLPGQSTTFEAALVGTFFFSTLDFQTESVALKIEERVGAEGSGVVWDESSEDTGL
jgi:hypothetical protein